MASKKILARVLTDLPHLFLRAGQVASGSPAVIKSLAAGGSVDMDKDAVTYARSQPGGDVVEVRSPDEQQARDAVQAEIDKLTTALAAADAKDKPEIQKAIEAKQAALADLD